MAFSLVTTSCLSRRSRWHNCRSTPPPPRPLCHLPPTSGVFGWNFFFYVMYVFLDPPPLPRVFIGLVQCVYIFNTYYFWCLMTATSCNNTSKILYHFPLKNTSNLNMYFVRSNRSTPNLVKIKITNNLVYLFFFNFSSCLLFAGGSSVADVSPSETLGN